MPTTARNRPWTPRRRTLIVAILVLAVGSGLVLALAARDTASEHRGEQVRALLLARGETSAAAFSEEGLNTGIENTCEARSPDEWAQFVRVGASINVGGDVDRQMIFVASYVDVGCPDQRTNLEQAARAMNAAIPSPR